MEIGAANRKLARALEDESARVRQYGPAQAKKIGNRIAAFRAAESLATFWPPNSGPERCHELTEDLAGTFSMDLKQPYRLLFQAVETTEREQYENEHERWSAIKKVVITAIEDTHG